MNEALFSLPDGCHLEAYFMLSQAYDYPVGEDWSCVMVEHIIHNPSTAKLCANSS